MIRISFCAESWLRDHRIKTSDFSWNVGVGSFDPLRVTIQGQIFFGGPWPPRTLLWIFLVVLRCREHEKLEPLDNFRSRRFHFRSRRFHFGFISDQEDSIFNQFWPNELSKKVWPWKVTVSRSNEQRRIWQKKSDVFILRSLLWEKLDFVQSVFLHFKLSYETMKIVSKHISKS